MTYSHCKKCLTSRTGDVLGGACKTAGCDGIIEEQPMFSTLVDVLPEPMTCGRRFDSYPGGIPVHQDQQADQDRWEKFKTNGNRVCSFCGSLHPDDLFSLVKQSAESSKDTPYGSVVEIEPSDKGYKIYVKQPGVRNAMEGGIKFYTQHLPRDTSGNLAVSPERAAEYAQAVRGTRARFEAYLDASRSARS